MTQKYCITKEKYEELKKEYEFLKGTRRKEIAESLEYAKSLGDLSENAEYHEARALQANVEERITKLEEILKSAVIASHTKKDIVEIGSVVKVKKKGETLEHEYCIVGLEETNLGENKISHSSPLGSALIGKVKGDCVVCCAPNGKNEYIIVDVR